MKVFLKNSLLFLAAIFALLLAGVALLSSWVSRQEFRPSNTESNLLILEKDKNYDYLFLGNSHARNFSRHSNQERVSAILQKEFLNLGQGLGICGTNDQLLYLKFALRKNIRFKKLIYTISPPYLYGAHLNRSSNTFFREPFRFDFFIETLRHPAPNKIGRLHHYLRSKTRPLWLNYHPENSGFKSEAMSRVDTSTFENGYKLAYPFGRQEEDFKECTSQLEEAIALARNQGAEIVLLTTPALIGHWPGQERVARYCDSLINNANDITYHDLSFAIQEPALFYDHHHLNSRGIDSLAVLLKKIGH